MKSNTLLLAFSIYFFIYVKASDLQNHSTQINLHLHFSSACNLDKKDDKIRNKIDQLKLFVAENSIKSRMREENFDNKVCINNISIPSYQQYNMTTEIKNYSLEIERHFKSFYKFKKISTHISGNTIIIDFNLCDE